ncbi:MAG: helix-turn-helix domain-containing protein [Nitriliruptor sp.]|nr:MAG: helix-turn-helix domain-containing protein [Nitriliruptor sp.]
MTRRSQVQVLSPLLQEPRFGGVPAFSDRAMVTEWSRRSQPSRVRQRPHDTCAVDGGDQPLPGPTISCSICATEALEGRMSAIDRVIEERDRREPGFAASVEAELAEIRVFDDVVNVVLDRLSELGWTREELAARADLNAASLRRLLTSSSANPTFATMMSIAEALGLRIELREQMSVEQMLAAS